MILSKIPTYFRYFKEYLRYRDFESLRDAANYILFEKGSRRNRTVKSRLGMLHTRKGTNDFQFSNYAYEWNVKKFILKHLTDYDYFFDIGAGIGEYGMLMSQKEKSVFLFEPLESSYRTISMNLRSNKMHNVSAYNYGLGDENIQTTFVINPVNTGASHVLRPGETIPENFSLSKVEIRTLDDVYSQMPLDCQKPILMKIDVEGMEAEVIKGAAVFLRACKNVMLIVEDKHAGHESIKNALDEINHFEIGRIDNLNMFAIKNSEPLS